MHCGMPGLTQGGELGQREEDLSGLSSSMLGGSSILGWPPGLKFGAI